MGVCRRILWGLFDRGFFSSGGFVSFMHGVMRCCTEIAKAFGMRGGCVEAAE